MSFINICAGCSLSVWCLPGILAMKSRFQKDDRIIFTTSRRRIELTIQELAKKLEINKPIELKEVEGLIVGAQAQGINLFSGRAGIVINPKLVEKLTSSELEFILAHELAHIKANDHLRFFAVTCVAGVIATVTASILFPSSALYFTPSVMLTIGTSSPAALAGNIASLFAYTHYSKQREKSADLLGLSICSEEAKKAAPIYFEKTRNAQMIHRKYADDSFSKLWRSFLITQDGDCRLDILHPPLKARIEYLKSANEKSNHS